MQSLAHSLYQGTDHEGVAYNEALSARVTSYIVINQPSQTVMASLPLLQYLVQNVMMLSQIDEKINVCLTAGPELA